MKEKSSQAETKSADPKTHDASHRPFQTFTSNRVEASVWKNVNDDGSFRYSFTIVRNYFDAKEKKPKRSHYLGDHDAQDLSIVTNALREFFRTQDLANDAYVD
jgi:hypothetical protein